MAVIAILLDKKNDELAARIAELYPDNNFKLTDTQYFISTDSIPQAVAEKLDVRTGKFGRVLVIRTSTSASGWHQKSVWEWLNQKASAE